MLEENDIGSCFARQKYDSLFWNCLLDCRTSLPFQVRSFAEISTESSDLELRLSAEFFREIFRQSMRRVFRQNSRRVFRREDRVSFWRLRASFPSSGFPPILQQTPFHSDHLSRPQRATDRESCPSEVQLYNYTPAR